jgi:hypothetical protein
LENDKKSRFRRKIGGKEKESVGLKCPNAKMLYFIEWVKIVKLGKNKTYLPATQ